MTHRQQFGQLIKDEMNKYGLIDAGWYYGYDNAKKRLGLCNHTQKLITFSLPFVDVNEIEIMTDTLLHEIAHALAGSKAKHGYDWRVVARRVGATPRACASDPRIIMPVGPYSMTCRCRTHYFHRSTVLGRKMRCRSCNISGIVGLTK